MEGEGFSPRQAGLKPRLSKCTPKPTSSKTSDDRRPGKRKKTHSATFLSDLRDLKVGDLIVHVDHGIGQFVGLKQISVGQRRRRPGISRAASITATPSCSCRSNAST